ncbi:MAG TPA: hypothetical protein VK212_03535 [Lentimicrobium sp.]|nr:hypothetical protein [Lentimicrobium sp.]
MRTFIHWFPRVLTILAICFVSMFAFDAFDPKLTLGQQILGFLIHMIPSFILLALLLIAWRYKLAGGIAFIILGIAFGIFLYFWNFPMNHNVWMTLGIVALLALPFVISGVLFYLDSIQIQRQK